MNQNYEQSVFKYVVSDSQARDIINSLISIEHLVTYKDKTLEETETTLKNISKSLSFVKGIYSLGLDERKNIDYRLFLKYFKKAIYEPQEKRATIDDITHKIATRYGFMRVVDLSNIVEETESTIQRDKNSQEQHSAYLFQVGELLSVHPLVERSVKIEIEKGNSGILYVGSQPKKDSFPKIKRNQDIFIAILDNFSYFGETFWQQNDYFKTDSYVMKTDTSLFFKRVNSRIKGFINNLGQNTITRYERPENSTKKRVILRKH